MDFRLCESGCTNPPWTSQELGRHSYAGSIWNTWATESNCAVKTWKNAIISENCTLTQNSVYKVRRATNSLVWDLLAWDEQRNSLSFRWRNYRIRKWRMRSAEALPSLSKRTDCRISLPKSVFLYRNINLKLAVTQWEVVETHIFTGWIPTYQTGLQADRKMGQDMTVII